MYTLPLRERLKSIFNLIKLKRWAAAVLIFFGVGVEILAMGIALLTFVGLIFSVLSAILAQKRVIKIISFVLILLFLFVPSFSYAFYLSIA